MPPIPVPTHTVPLNAQKATIGLVIPEIDMPVGGRGTVPDIIVNPHAIPTPTLPIPVAIPVPVPTPTLPIPVPIPIPTPTLPIPVPVPTLTLPIPVPVPTPTRLVVAPPTPVIKEIVLRPWQTAWAHRAYQIMLRNHGYIDTSKMGSGKTYVLLWLAKQFGFPLIIICPVIMIDIWRKTAAEYSVPVINIIGYQALRSQTNQQPKHGLLTRHDNITEGGTHQISFQPTPAYLELVANGVMIVCDEMQNIKNNSAQYKACNALLRPIISAGGTSRFALLSGTPFDKLEHAVNLLRLIGYIRAHRLYNYITETRELILEGMQELIDACMFINAEETGRILAEIPLIKSKMNQLAYELYTRVVKQNISGAMPTPTTIQGRFDIKNGFFNMTDAATERLREAINDLGRATRFNERTGTVDMRGNNLGAITTALVHIENAKVETFARVATSILMANPTSKVIISLNYISTIEEIATLMIFFNPLILTGSVPAAKRPGIIDRFNTDPTYRLLIMNTQVGGVGISLHDTVGNAPRFMLISPSYKMIEIAQSAARIHRDGTISDATVRMIYGNLDDAHEDRILEAMARKSQILKGTLEMDINPDLILPGDYPAEREAR
jgi:hypothetical protein